MKEELIVNVVVGYMLKVLKNKKDVSKFKKEFACIRHGNYDEFIKLIGGDIPFMVVGDLSTGEVGTENLTQKNTCDFGGLLLSGPSLEKFGTLCFAEFGQVIDNDIADEIYRKLVYFELSLRMHGNNAKILIDHEELNDVIDKVGILKFLTKSEIETLHLGRKFLNMVKHSKNRFKTFKTYGEGIVAFEKAFEMIKKHGLTII